MKERPLLNDMADLEDFRRDDDKPMYESLINGGIDGLIKPNYHAMNEHAGRNDRLLHAVMCAYAKHHLDNEDIGWTKLSDILHCAICNEIGDDAFIKWGNSVKEDVNHADNV